MDIETFKTIWAFIGPFAGAAFVAWMALMRKQSDLAMEDKKLTWWEVRGLFISIWASIPPAFIAGFTGFPIGSFISLLIKIFYKAPAAVVRKIKG